MSKAKFWALLITTCVVSLILLSVLSHNKYLRYQALDVGVFKKATWIYERTVFDPTPIDIAFFGTSHTLNAIDSTLVEEYINVDRTPKKHVVNFAIPQLGRDMHQTLVKLLLEHRQPEILFIEIRETETRDQHPATYYLANSLDMINSPLLVNSRYFGNLARLPLRQSSLFLKTQFPDMFGVTTEFDQQAYAGAHQNYALAFPDGKSRHRIRTEQILVEKRLRWKRKNAHKLLRDNKLKNFINYNANLTILRNLISLAKKQGIEVYFIYLPDFGSQAKPVDEEIYQAMAPILYIDDPSIYTNTNNWYDLGHLNAQGAMRYTKSISKVINNKVLNASD
jgi:hypothetical protein